MTEFETEQQMEIEIKLRSSYVHLIRDIADLLQLTQIINVEYEDSTPQSWPKDAKVYCILISADDDGVSLQDKKTVEFIFAHTPNYPDEPPLYKLVSTRGMSENDINTIYTSLQEAVNESLGMSMIFNLVSVIKSWLQDQATDINRDVEEEDELTKMKRLQEEEERRLAEIRALGTPVTEETFAKWKADFLTEVARDEEVMEDSKRLTGKQYFRSLELSNKGDDAQYDKEFDDEEFIDEEAFDDEDDDFDEEEFDEDEEIELLDKLIAEQ